MINLVFDVETTGLTKHPSAKDREQPRIIEFAGVWVDENGVLIKELVYLINPMQLVTEEITKITGIKQEDVDDKPTFAEVRTLIFDFIKNSDQAIAHNLPFDRMLVELEAARLGLEVPWPKHLLCTVQEHADEWGYRPKLTQLYEHYTGQPLAQTHRALDDVMALVEVCKCAGVLL